MILYISGPMTGRPDFNRPMFAKAENALKHAGYEVISPAYINEEIGDGLPWETYMRAAIRLMLDADGVVILPEWMDSRGARAEVSLAEALGMPVKRLGGWILNEGGAE